MPEELGLFLGETWRMHPEVCAFTSELFYEAKLRARPGLERQCVSGPTRFAGAGLFFVPVLHEGTSAPRTPRPRRDLARPPAQRRRTASRDEAERVPDVVRELPQAGVTRTREPKIHHEPRDEFGRRAENRHEARDDSAPRGPTPTQSSISLLDDCPSPSPTPTFELAEREPTSSDRETVAAVRRQSGSDAFCARRRPQPPALVAR